MVESPDSAIHFTKLPGCELPQKLLLLVLFPSFYFWPLSLSLPAAIVFFLSLFHNCLLFSCPFTPSLSQSAQRAPDNDNNAAASLQLWRLAPHRWQKRRMRLCSQPAGYTWREAITRHWRTEPNESVDHSMSLRWSLQLHIYTYVLQCSFSTAVSWAFDRSQPQASVYFFLDFMWPPQIEKSERFCLLRPKFAAFTV